MCVCVCVWAHVWVRCFSNFLCSPFSWLLAKLWVACVVLSLHIYIKQSCTSSLYLQLCICHFTVAIRCLSGPLPPFISFPPRSHPVLCFFPVMCPVRLDQHTCLLVCVSAVFLQCFYFEMPHWCCYSFTRVPILLCIWLFFRQPVFDISFNSLPPTCPQNPNLHIFLMDIPNVTLEGGLTQNSWHLLLWLVDLSFTFCTISVFPASLLISWYCGCFCRTGNESVSPQSVTLAFYHTQTWRPSSGCFSLL